MRRISIFALNLIALAVTALPVSAQAAEQKVSVRSGEHDGYTRIVLDGTATQGYAAKESTGSLTLTFKSAADFSVAAPAPETLARVSGFAVTPTVITLTYPKGQTIRHFMIGTRLIVDIKGAATQPVKKPVKEPNKEEPKDADKVVPPAPEVKPPVAEPVKQTPKPETSPQPEAKPADKIETKTDTTPPSPAPTETVAPASFDAHMISITATQATGLAVFERSGTLWLVVDKEDYPVYPQIAGPQKDKFPPFNRVTTKGGTAFTLKLPPGLQVYGEGGGLVWKVILTPTTRKVQPVDFTRSFDQVQKPGGVLLWPATDSRVVLDLTDPEIGDTLKVVPVLSSRSFTGAEQDFVEFDSQKSAVGLAVLPKVDGLEVTRGEKGVTITLPPNGLAISAETDMSTLKLKQQQAAAETAPARPRCQDAAA